MLIFFINNRRIDEYFSSSVLLLARLLLKENLDQLTHETNLLEDLTIIKQSLFT